MRWRFDVRINTTSSAKVAFRLSRLLDWAVVDPFVILVLVGGGVVVGWLWLLGTANQGGATQFGLRSARQIVEEREALEAEDLDEMLEAHNVRRRARGLGEETERDILRDLPPRG